MSFDAKLILAALDEHFDAVEAKWDRFFAARDQKWAKQVVPGEHNFHAPIVADEIHHSNDEIRTGSCLTSTELPVADDAGREAPLAARVTSTATCAVEIIGSVGPLPASRPQSGAAAEREVPVPPPATSSPATTTSPPTASSAATIDIQHGAPATSSASTWLTTQPTALTATSILLARGAEESSTNSPLWFSTDCFSNYIDLLEPISVAMSSSLTPDGPSTEDEATTKSSTCSFECIQVWYISDSTLSYSNGVVVLPCLSTRVPDVKLALEGLVAQKSVMLMPMFDHRVSKAPWPPPNHFDMQRTAVQLRPIPWPSFGYLNVHCASCQHNKKGTNSLLWIVWKNPWLFSVFVCWNSESLAAVTVITRAHMLLQYLSTLHRPISIQSDDGIFSWPQTQIIGDSVHARILQVAVLKWLSGWCEYAIAKVSGGDGCWLDEFKSIDVLGNFQLRHVDLSFVKKRGWLVLVQFLPSDSRYVVFFQFFSGLHWPLRMDSDNSLLGYFSMEDHSIFGLYQIRPPTTFISTRSTKLLCGQHKVFGAVMSFTNICYLQSVVYTFWDLWHLFFSGGKISQAALHKYIIKLKLGGVDPGDIHMSFESYMVITLYIFRASTYMVSANTWLHCTVSALPERYLGFHLVEILPALCIVLISDRYNYKNMFSFGLHITPWQPLAEASYICCLWYLSLGELFLWQHRLNPHDGVEVTLWSFDKRNQHIGDLWQIPELSCCLIVSPEEQEWVELAHETSRFPRCVRDTIFKLQFYHLVIEDP